jgi:hypothetical protein
MTGGDEWIGWKMVAESSMYIRGRKAEQSETLLLGVYGPHHLIDLLNLSAFAVLVS